MASSARLEADGNVAQNTLANRVAFVQRDVSDKGPDYLFSLLCTDIFGSEVEFLTRKQCLNIREYLRGRSTDGEIFEIGTRAEGYRISGGASYLLPCLDLEVLCTIYDSQRKSLSFRLVEIPNKPTFCNLKLVKSDIPLSHPIINICKQVDGNQFLSAKLVKDNFSRFHEILGLPKCPKIAGPNAYRYDSDFLICIPCSTWPPQAFSMVQRQRRNQFPTNSDIDKIVRKGCYVVVGSDEELDEDELTFRLSFELAIRELISSFNQSQLNLLGLMLLFVQKTFTDDAIRKMMTSALKHCMFWTCYDLQPTMWDLDFFGCFEALLQRINQTIEHSWCASFFVRQCDVYEGKVNDRVRSILKQAFANLKNNGWHHFLKFPEFRPFEHYFNDVETYIFKLCSENTNYKQHYGLFAEMSQTAHEMRRILSKNPPKNLISFLHLQRDIRDHCPPHIRSDLMDIILDYSNIVMATYLERKILINETGNRNRHTPVANVKFLLEKGSKFNLAAGSLKLSTIFLFLKRTTECKKRVDDIIETFQSSVVIMPQRYSLCGIRSSSAEVEEYVRISNSLELTDSKKMCGLMAYWVEFSPLEIDLLPKALRYELQSLQDGEDVLHVDPLVFCYFLRSLCSHFHDTEEVRNSIIDKLRTIVDKTQDSRNYHINLNLLGYCLILAGSTEEARVHFQKSLDIVANNNAASIHLQEITR